MGRNSNSSKGKIVEIDWKPDKNSAAPVYQQITGFIAKRIRRGDWSVGDMLPSQRKMAEMFGVNRSTIVTALEELTSYGILSSIQGSGTRISGGSWPLRLASPPDWGSYIQSGSFHANKPTIQTINRKEYEEGYIKIGTGELSPDLYPERMMSEIIDRAKKRIPSLGYLGGLGLPELRGELSRYLKEEKGIQAEAENILITTGSLQALQLISICMMKRGSFVYTERPTYLKSLFVFQSAGMQLEGLPMDDDGLLFHHLTSKDYGNSIIYSIPTFHNPTGIVMTQERRLNLLKFCQEHQIPLIEDSAYEALWLDEKPPNPVKSLDESGNVLYLGTFSKCLAPGLRIGWVVGPRAVVNRLGDVKMQIDYGSSSVSQWITAELLHESEMYKGWLDALRQELRSRRAHALHTVEKYFSGLCTWTRPAGGFYIWLQFPKKLPMDRIFERALQEKILINPGNVYDYAENNAIRLSYAYTSPEEMSAALRVLADIIKENP